MSSATRYLPRALKNLVPGYRNKWRRQYAALLHEIRGVVPTLEFDQFDNVPQISVRERDLKLCGFWTASADAELFDNLAPDLPGQLPREHFRLVRDFITRYQYPHLRPDLKPSGYSRDQLHGFHGQHKDAIIDLTNRSQISELIEVFRPKPGEVIIDGGAFLGFGDLRVAEEIGDGRIYAVEASSECHALLARNVKMNGSHNVVPLRNAIWNSDGEMKLGTTFAQGNSLVSGKVKGFSARTVFETVAASTVDSIVESHGVTRLDMLSFTLNGAEPEALEGAVKTLSELRPRVRAPGYYYRDERQICDILKSQLEEFDYQVFVGSHGNTMAFPR